MAVDISFQQPQVNRVRLLRIMLMLLVFTAWHVATHDIDFSGNESDFTECQICNLNDLPITNLPPLSWIVVPLLTNKLTSGIATLQRPAQLFYPQGARAPPLV